MHGIKNRIDSLFHRKMEANHDDLLTTGKEISFSL